MAWLDFLFGTAPPAEKRDWSVSDPAFAAWLEAQGINWFDGTDHRALSLSAVYRCVSIIAGTIAGLPLKTYRERNGVRKDVGSWISDNPAGPYDISAFSWKELVVAHMVMRGETFLAHTFNGAGQLIGLLPIHPQAITDVDWLANGDKLFTANVLNLDETTSVKTFTSETMTQVMGLTLDGLRGISPIHAFRKGLATALAGEESAKNAFTTGLSIKALVTPEQDITEADAAVIKTGLSAKMTGSDNAGGIAVVNRKLHVDPLSFSAEDSQFIQSRQFSIEEIARMFGIPTNLLSINGAISNWGTGVAEANAGLARYTLMGYTGRLEEALSNLLPSPQHVEFSYKGLLQGTPEQEINLLIAQVAAGLLTHDEARAVLNMPPIQPAAAPPVPGA